MLSLFSWYPLVYLLRLDHFALMFAESAQFVDDLECGFISMLSHIHPVPVDTTSRPLPACLDQRRDRLDSGKYH